MDVLNALPEPTTTQARLYYFALRVGKPRGFSFVAPSSWTSGPISRRFADKPLGLPTELIGRF